MFIHNSTFLLKISSSDVFEKVVHFCPHFTSLYPVRNHKYVAYFPIFILGTVLVVIGRNDHAVAKWCGVNLLGLLLSGNSVFQIFRVETPHYPLNEYIHISASIVKYIK